MAYVDQSKANYILSLLKGLEYGSVVITVHDGGITQIDKTEKTRFAQQKSTPLKNKSNPTYYWVHLKKQPISPLKATYFLNYPKDEHF